MSRWFDRNPAAEPPPPSHQDLEAASVATLVDLLDESRAGVRADAACALGDRLRTGELAELGPSARVKLVDLLDDPEVMVRFEAAVALAEVHDYRATPLLLGAMRSRAVRLDAIRALGTMGDPTAVAPLERFMGRWLLPWADRLQAAAALCALGQASGADYLAGKLDSRKRAERAAAVHFIGESRHPRALAILEELVANRDEPLRDVAVRALGILADPACRSALEKARADADEELRSDIDDALARLG